MAASTPSTCLRSESDSVHSQNSSQASSRVGAVRAALGHPGRVSARGNEIARPDGLRYPCPAARRAALQRHHAWRSSSSKAASRCRGPSCPPATRTPRCPRSRPRSSPRRRSCCATSRASATWRRCSALLRGLGANAEWREDNVVALTAAEITSTTVDADLRRAHPRLLPAGRPAAGPLRRGRHAAARRRRDRPPPPRSPPRRVPAPWAPRSRPSARTSSRAPRACARATSSWTSRR